MAEIYQLPDNQGNNAGMGNIPFSIPIGGFGGGLFGGNGLFDLLGLGIIGSMLNGGGFGSPSPSADFSKPKLEEDENKEKEQIFAIPTK